MSQSAHYSNRVKKKKQRRDLRFVNELKAVVVRADWHNGKLQTHGQPLLQHRQQKVSSVNALGTHPFSGAR